MTANDEKTGSDVEADPKVAGARRDERLADDGDVVTSAGIDMALHS